MPQQSPSCKSQANKFSAKALLEQLSFFASLCFSFAWSCQSECDGLEPRSDGLQPTSDGLQPRNPPCVRRLLLCRRVPPGATGSQITVDGFC